MDARCGHCGKSFEILTGAYNRAMKAGLKVYCNHKHAGMARRSHKTKAQLKEEKHFYDCFYRVFNQEKIKKDKAAYFKKDYEANPRKYKRWQKRKSKAHTEYCRRPEYKKYSRQYAIKRHHQEYYGPFWEASALLVQLEAHIDKYEARQQAGTHNKIKKRKQLQSWKSNLLPSISKTSCGKL
jgi:hypothetical protein